MRETLTPKLLPRDYVLFSGFWVKKKLIWYLSLRIDLWKWVAGFVISVE